MRAAKHVVIGKQSLPAVAENIMARKKFKSHCESDPRYPYHQSLPSVLRSDPRDREPGNKGNCCAEKGRAYDVPSPLIKNVA
jgi:hypothetical protein